MSDLLDELETACAKARKIANEREALYQSGQPIQKALFVVLFDGAPILEGRNLPADMVVVLREDSRTRVFCGREARPRFERLVEQARADIARRSAT